MLLSSRSGFYYNHKFWYFLIMLVFGAIYYTIAIADHYYFRTTAFDYGTYNFAFWDYAHFRVSTCPVYYRQHMNFLQDHFSLTLMYFVPVYWLLNWLTGTYTLVLIQVTAVLIGGWATYRFISLKTQDPWLGVASLLYYFLLQGHFSMFAGDCNVAVISASFIPLFLYYFELKKYKVATVFFVLALFSRENLPLWFIAILPIVMLWHRKERRVVLICLWYMIAAAFYFVLLFKVIIPHLETADKHYNIFNYSALGSNPFDALKYVMHHPANTFKMFFFNKVSDDQYDPLKKEFYLVYLISGGFMLFYRPQYFIWFIPLLAQKMLNDQPIRWSIEWHYAIEVVTMLPLAVFMIITNEKSKKWRYILAGMVCCLTFFMTWYEMQPDMHIMPWSGVEKEAVFGKNFFHSDLDVKKIHHDIAQIPADAKVSASASILPHLAQRMYIYEFPKVDDAQYITAFTYHDYFEVTDSDYFQSINQYIFSPEWNIVANDFPALVLKHEKNTYKHEYYDTVTCNAELINKRNNVLIASNGANIYFAQSRDSTMARSGKYSCKLSTADPFGMTYIDSNLKENDIVYASIWRHSEGVDNGILVVSCGKDFYTASSTPSGKDAAGWEQIEIFVKVPADFHNFRIYAWGNKDTPVWFDDLKVMRFRGK